MTKIRNQLFDPPTVKLISSFTQKLESECLIRKFSKSICRSSITNLHSLNPQISDNKNAYTWHIILDWITAFFWVSCIKLILGFLGSSFDTCVPDHVSIQQYYLYTNIIHAFKLNSKKITHCLKVDMTPRMIFLKTKKAY